MLPIIGTVISGLLALLLFFLIGGAGIMFEDLGRATAASPDLGPLWEAIADSMRALGQEPADCKLLVRPLTCWCLLRVQ